MESQIKTYRLFLVINIIFIPIVIALAIYFISSTFVSWFTEKYIWYFIITLAIFFINSLFVFLILKYKYPAQFISNKIEGLFYFFTILSFLSAFVTIVLIYGFAQNAIDYGSKKPNPFIRVLLSVSAPSFIVMVCTLTIALYSFKILKVIRKNRQVLADQIKNLGTNNE